MNSEEDRRTRVLAYASERIGKDYFVVCICGQLFIDAEHYATHVLDCVEVDRYIQAS